MTSSIAGAATSIDDTKDNYTGDYTVEFAERYQPDLELDPSADDFGRPARNWSWKGRDIGTYVDYSLLVDEYTTAIDGKDLYELLSRTTIENSYVDYFVDGKEDTTIAATNMIRTNTEDYNTTGNGVLTQVFYDQADEQITITSINTYLAEVTSDYNENRETLAVKVYAPNDKRDNSISIEDVEGIEDYEEGDMLLVNVAYTGASGTVKYAVVAVAEPETMSNVDLTKYSANKYMVTGGTQYDYAATAKSSDPDTSLNEITSYGNNALTDYSYNLYLDQYGYLIGNEIAEGEDNYVFIAGYDYSGSNLANATARASAIFLDGSMSNISVDVRDTNKRIDTYNAGNGTGSDYAKFTSTDTPAFNKWFTYVTDDDVYTLTPVDNWMDLTYADNVDEDIVPYSVRLQAETGITISYASTTLAGRQRAYGNDESVYITVKADVVDDGTTKAGIVKTLRTYTGVDETRIAILDTTENGMGGASVYAVYDDDNYIIGAIVLGEDKASTDSYAYMLKDVGNEYIDEDDNYYWDVEASVDGTETTLTIKTDVSDFSTVRTKILNAIGAGKAGMMRVYYDADGYVVDADNISDSDTGVYGNSDFGTDVDPDDFNVYTVGWGAMNVSGGVSANFNISGRTLYAHDSDAGLRLASGAPVIVIQPRQDNTPAHNRLSDSIESFSDFKSAVESLDNGNNNNGYNNFVGWISAVIGDNGQASYVVISSDTVITVDTTGGSGRPSEVSDITNVQLMSNKQVLVTGATAGASYEYTLYKLGSDRYAPVTDGTLTCNAAGYVDTAAPDFGPMLTNGSFYIEIDGVSSNYMAFN